MNVKKTPRGNKLEAILANTKTGSYVRQVTAGWMCECVFLCSCASFIYVCNR